MASKERECPSCALMIDADAEDCPYCGYELPKSSRGLGVVAVLLIALLLFGVFELLTTLLR